MAWAAGYREWRPPAALHQGVSCLWVRVVPETGGSFTLVLPDACADLMWQQDRGAFVAGPDTGPNPSLLPPGSVIVGARFPPGAGGPALGVPLSELRNLRVDLVDLHRELARWLPGELAPGEALERIVRASAALLSAGPPDAVVGQGARLLNEPGATVEGVVRRLAVSERQLRRRFQAGAGYGPKTLHSVLRFRRFLDRLDGRGAAAGLAEIALDSGYADQAHLTRETGRLAGLPPAALARARAGSS
ncbi:MAG: helix-turn-helix domain-containing protein [bacterium]|jgi:AraC-like DNA-binding protein|nr:helix-turn-helix domain-containing protein [bacterium]